MHTDRYVITLQVIAGRKIPGVEISKEEFDRIKEAKEHLLNAIAVEEKIRYVVENYRELELELIHEALDDMLFQKFDWNDGIDKLHRVSRRIVNLLSTSRAYLDHIEHHISRIFGNPSQQLTDVRTQKSEIYDSSLAYRTMEALRNFVQHRQLPIGMIVGGAAWVSHGKDEFRMHTVRPNLRMRDIDDEKFKRKIFYELKAFKKPEIELKPLIDEYLEGLIKLHEFVRGMLSSISDDAGKLMKESISRFQTAGGSDKGYADLVHMELDCDNWIAKEGVPLINELSERLSQLKEHTRVDMRFTEQYATSIGKGRKVTRATNE